MSVMLDAIYCKSIACWEPTAGNRAHPASTSMAVCCGKISSPLSYALISNPTVACSSHAAPTNLLYCLEPERPASSALPTLFPFHFAIGQHSFLRPAANIPPLGADEP